MASTLVQIVPHQHQHIITSHVPNRNSHKALSGGLMHMGSNPLAIISPKFNKVSFSIGVDGKTLRGNEGLLTQGNIINQGRIWTDSNIYESLLQRCIDTRALIQGKTIHCHIIKTGFQTDVYLTTTLLTMYVKCGSLAYACQVFDKMSERNFVSWTAMISGYAQHGRSGEAFLLFNQMQIAGEKPNQFTFGSVLQACANLAALENGRQVHACVIKTLVKANIIVENALVDMYAKCHNIVNACQVFDKMPERNVVSWTALIAGYARQGFGEEGLVLFQQMQCAGVKASCFTFTSILSICANLVALEHGKQLHACIIKMGFQGNASVGNALVDMYGKCADMVSAHQVFEQLPELREVSWNALIAGYVKQERHKEALEIFEQMQRACMKPDHFTFASVISSYASLAVLHKGKQVHAHIIRGGFELNTILGTALIDMYAKCGHIEYAQQVFDRMPQLDLIAWNAMVAGYGKHGRSKEALQLFNKMEQAGMKPNHSSFVSILSACSHAGLVEEGWRYFYSMSQDRCITPTAEHYACMVDLLGRAGSLDEAHDFINNMPIEPDAVVWGALLAACSAHVNLELGRYAAERLFQLEPESSGMYVVLSNMYAAAGRWDDVVMVRKLMKDRGLNKEPGCSWIEVKNKVYTFLAGDRSHAETEKIYAMLEILTDEMKKLGYVPKAEFALHD